MKKLLRVFFVLFVLLSLSVVFTACGDIPTYNSNPIKYTKGLTYTRNPKGSGYIVTGIGSAEGNDIIIPSTYKYSPVVGISETAFKNNTTITSITIPDSITSIENNAFTGCSSLQFNTYNDIKYLGTADNPYFALIKPTNNNCSSYEIHSDAKIIANSAFENHGSLTNVSIPNNVTAISDSAFRRCSKLTSITIPDSVKTIEKWAFDDCSSLTSITIPDSVTSIGSSTFNGCTSLKSITIPDGVTSIDVLMFYRCSSLTSITIPDSVTSIGGGAFDGCTSLTSITIPDSVTTIGHGAFSGCSKLTSITIPDSVTSIEERVFEKCVNLIDISVKTNNEVYSSINGNLYNKDGTELIRYAIGKSDSSFTIPSSVTSIGYEAFKDCSSLTSITIPDSVTYVSYFTFEGCNSLEFNAYDNANYLGNDNNPYYALIRIANTNYSNCKIHSDTKIIADGSFTYCNALTSITIPDSVTYICDYAFEGCDSLTSVTIGNSVTHINDFAFGYCSNLTSVNIPDSVTSIGGYAFLSCNSLTNIVIPDSVTFIDSHAFTINNPNFTIFCEATSKPNGWDSSWNSDRPVYWYSENEPTKSGKYWHYDENGEIEIWE